MAGLNMSLVKRRRQEIDKQEEDRKKGAHWDKLKEGDNDRRFLPPWSEEGNWRRVFGQHYNVLDDDTVLCPQITFGEDCPICNENKALFASGDPGNKELAKKIRGKEAFVANVLNLDLNDSKVYTLEFGVGVEADITRIIDPGEPEVVNGRVKEQFGYGDITDPKTGRTIRITKTVPADKMQTSYEVAAAVAPSPVANWEEVSKNIHNLDEYVKAKRIYTHDDLLAMVAGTFQPKDKPAAKQEAPKQEVAPTPNVVSEEFVSSSKAVLPTPVVETPKVEAPKQEAPKAEPVASTQPAPVTGALAKLKAMQAQKAAEGKK